MGRRKKRVTIFDVARLAGVGIGTVSRVINDKPEVSADTRRKVLRAMDELGYVPSPHARALAGGRTHSVGLVTFKAAQYFFFEIFRGVQEAVENEPYNLVLFSLTDEDEVNILIKKSIEGLRVEGLLVLSVVPQDDVVNIVRDHNFPVVLVDAYHPLLDSITVDNVTGAYQAVSHLLSKGCTRIGFVNGFPRSQVAKERYTGYLAAHEDMGVEPVEELVVWENFTNEGGYRGAKRVMEHNPDALFVASDVQTLGVLDYLREINMQPGKDIPVVSYDDLEFSKYIGLTTVHQPIKLMGKKGLELLLKRISTGYESPIEKVVYSTYLVVRETG